jgi:tRNA 5-methylaminomethyl-2-thiouridine biosynthesis bifunctional protein
VIKPAELVWRDGQPYSAAYRDIYHDRDGIGEIERVFLAPADFQGLLDGNRPLVIAELGFGTGLNFTVIARHCLAARVPLHFISFEAAPIHPTDFTGLGRSRQAAEPVYAELTSIYPPLLAGWHRRGLAGGQIQLSLYWGEAEEGLSALDGQREPVDLWLLDGFAPDRNPDMWADDLLAAVGRTATAGTRVTTFTAAGRVRRGLAAAGFEMRRVDQRPHKRESLAGVYTDTGLLRPHRPDRATVMGAGLAGAAVARELAGAGIDVCVLEAAAAPATGASGIPATVMHPRLHHDDSDAANLKAIAYAHAIAATRNLAGDGETGLVRTGALQIPSPNFPIERLEAVAERYRLSGLGVELVDRQTALERVGAEKLALPDRALWFADACTVDTPRFTRYLLDHPAIEVRYASSGSDWPAGPVVLACGMSARDFSGAAYLELGAVGGQLDLVERASGLLTRLTAPITGHGYLAPLDDQRIGVGATYEYQPWPSERSTAANLRHVERLTGALDARVLGQHKAIRCVASDRNPVIGPLVAPDGREDVEHLVSVGHGSMGTVTSQLAASLIGATLTGQFPPLTAPLQRLVSTARFRERQARRGYRFGARP